MQHLAGDRRHLVGLELGDWLQAIAIFVAERKAEQQIFDRVKTGSRQIRDAAGADALHVLERHLKDVRLCHREKGKEVQKTEVRSQEKDPSKALGFRLLAVGLRALRALSYGISQLR